MCHKQAYIPSEVTDAMTRVYAILAGVAVVVLLGVTYFVTQRGGEGDDQFAQCRGGAVAGGAGAHQHDGGAGGVQPSGWPGPDFWIPDGPAGATQCREEGSGMHGRQEDNIGPGASERVHRLGQNLGV